MSDTDKLFAVTCVFEGHAEGAFIIASDRDDAIGLAQGSLPDNARVTHVLQICPASLANLDRNKLATLIPREQQLQFTSMNLLKLITIQQGLCESLGAVINRYETLVNETLREGATDEPDSHT